MIDGVSINHDRRSISRNGIEVILTPQQFKVFDYLATSKHGVSAERLFDFLYADDPDGGPLRGRKVMHVLRVNINHKLEQLGICISSTRKTWGTGGLYQVIVT